MLVSKSFKIVLVVVLTLLLLAFVIPKFTVASISYFYTAIPITLSQMYTAQQAYKAENKRFGSTEEIIDSGLSLERGRELKFIYENVTDSTFTAVAIITINKSGLKVGDRATIDQDANKWSDQSILKRIPTWYASQ